MSWLLLLLIGLAGWPVISDLALCWWTAPDRQYGILLCALGAASIARGLYRTRDLAGGPPGRLPGALLALGGLIGAFGALGLAPFISRLGLLAMLSGAVLAIAGGHPQRRRGVALGLLLLLVSIPAPREAILPLTDWMRDAVTGWTAGLLNLIGIEARARMNTLYFGGGRLQILSACNGLRSLAVLLAAGLLWSQYVGPRGWLRRGLLLALIPPLAIGANMLRILLVALLARAGAGRIEPLHQLLGAVVFVLPLGGMLLLCHWLADGKRVAERPCSGGSRRRILACGLLAVICVLGARTLAGRRQHESVDVDALVATLLEENQLRSRSGRIDPAVARMMRPDRTVVRILYPEGGEPIQLVIFYYRDLRSSGTLFSHSPLNCYRTAGWIVTDEALHGNLRGFQAERGGRRRAVLTWFALGRRRVATRRALYLQSLLRTVREGRTDGMLVLLATRCAPGERMPEALTDLAQRLAAPHSSD